VPETLCSGTVMQESVDPRRERFCQVVETLYTVLTPLFLRLLRFLHCRQNYKIWLITPQKLKMSGCLIMTVTNKNYSIEIKSRLNRGECLLP